MNAKDREEFTILKNDVKEIRQNQDAMNEKIEKLFEKASQPIFTTKEMLTILLSVIAYTVIISVFISDIKALANNNKEKIENDLKVNEIILDKVNSIAIDVAVVKSEQKRLNK